MSPNQDKTSNKTVVVNKEEVGLEILPKPDEIVTYDISSDEPNRGVLYLYGNPSSEKIAIMCPGYADDHTVFQKFAYQLSKQGKGNTFVGVMCLPGYDHRPDDGVSWTTHKKDGYSFDEWSNAIDNAVKVLRSKSTYRHNKGGKGGGVNETKFTAIFHDLGVYAGTIWMNRVTTLAAEAKKKSKKDDDDDDDNNIMFVPTNVVYFDILFGPSSNMRNDEEEEKEKDVEYEPLTLKQNVCRWLYRIVFASSFLIQRYISKPLASLHFIFNMLALNFLGLGPCYNELEIPALQTVYTKHTHVSISRRIYMQYPYWNMFKGYLPWSSSSSSSLSSSSSSSSSSPSVVSINDITLHDDWKTTPICYIYGNHKRTMFHDPHTVAMLKRDEQKQKESNNKRSCKVISIEDAGHFIYLQQPDLCLNAVIDFMDTTI